MTDNVNENMEETFDLEEQDSEADTPDVVDTKSRELSEEEYQALPITEQRKYRANAPARKREAARKRKQAERDRKKATGIAAGIENKLKAEWKANLTDVQTNPARAEEFAELKERLVNFSYIREETRAVINRIRQHVHPEAEGPGRFFEFIAADYIEHARKYGTGPYEPPFLIVMKLDAKNHMVRNKALQELKENPVYRFRIFYGLDIDAVNHLEFNELMESFFSWYLDKKPRPDYDYDFSDADILVNEFEIPAKLLKHPFGDDKSIWNRLDNFRSGRTDTDKPRSTTTMDGIIHEALVRDSAAIRKTLTGDRLQFLKAHRLLDFQQ